MNICKNNSTELYTFFVVLGLILMILITIRLIEVYSESNLSEHYTPITWTPYYVDDWNQPGLNNYFYMNNYYYPVF